jgi:transposase-like protein
MNKALPIGGAFLFVSRVYTPRLCPKLNPQIPGNSPLFKFSPDIRKAVYTTNAIESVNYTIQKIIKHRQSFPNDEAATKLIFMGLKHISRKWTMPIRDWGAALNQFAIIYGEDRVPDVPFTQNNLRARALENCYYTGTL